MNNYLFKPVDLGVVCYMALDNQNKRAVTVLDDKEMTPLPFGALLVFLWSINQIMSVRTRKGVEVLNNTVENLEINSLKSIHILVPLRNSLYIPTWGPLFQPEGLDKTICGTVIRHFWCKSRRKEVRSATICSFEKIPWTILVASQENELHLGKISETEG